MAKSRTQTWLALILLPVGLVLVGVPGIFVFMKVTARPLHPDPKEVPSVTQAAPLSKWSGAVEQGRQIVRATLPSGTCRGFRWRSVSAATSCGRKGLGLRISRSGAGHAEAPVPDRNGIHGAHLGRGGPAAGGRPAEAG